MNQNTTGRVKRVEWIDVARGICILCVVLSHTLEVPSLYRSIFSPFFLTTFFFLSGVVYKSSTIKSSCLASVAKILWPYVINAVVIIFLRLKWVELAIAGDVVGVWSYFQTALIRLVSGKIFWFLACLFIVQILATVITHVVKSKIALAVISGLCLLSIFIINGQDIYPWSANTAIFALGYFLLGVVLKERLLSFELQSSKRYIGWICMGVYVALILVLNAFAPQATQFDIHIHKLAPEWRYLLLSLVGITAVCLFSMSIYHCKPLQLFGANSLVIYMYHGYGGLITNTIFGYVGVKGILTSPYIYTIVFCCVSASITLLFALFINKYCPILVGRSKFISKCISK